MQPVKYFYSKLNSFPFTILLTGIIILSIPHIIKFVYANDMTNWLLIITFDFLLLVILIYLIVKQLIPAIKGKVALEINSVGIISYVKNIEVLWKDIQEIDQVTGKTSSAINIKFKYKTDRGNHIRIGLGFIGGDDSEIYNTIISFFEKSKE